MVKLVTLPLPPALWILAVLALVNLAHKWRCTGQVADADVELPEIHKFDLCKKKQKKKTCLTEKFLFGESSFYTGGRLKSCRVSITYDIQVKCKLDQWKQKKQITLKFKNRMT